MLKAFVSREILTFADTSALVKLLRSAPRRKHIFNLTVLLFFDLNSSI